jgi:hypothetical protein
MSLAKLYRLQCARCFVVDDGEPKSSPVNARRSAQSAGWRRLAWIYTQGRDNTRHISGATEDYCPTCVPLVQAEYREIKSRESVS